MPKPRHDLSSLFQFEEVASDRFETKTPHVQSLRLYGGQLLAQGLAALQRTVPETRPVHSLHAYFVRGAQPNAPLEYRVWRDRDGRSFSARRLEAIQCGEMMLSMAASFHDREAGPMLQLPMPEVPPPEELDSIDLIVDPLVSRFPVHVRPFWEADIGIEYRFVEPFTPLRAAPSDPRRHFWMRAADPIDAAEQSPIHAALFAYASDMHILDTGLLPLGFGWGEPTLGDASLDHSIWFHGQFRMDEWLLYALDSPGGSSNRFLGRGQVFTRDGRMVASVAQEGLIRIPPSAGMGSGQNAVSG
ncbi:MAG TPA: acyl-CoA thioesterase domain-containing protein [Allosphingosinicella sp.]|jgi:acyl-CoA thioesterase-2